MAIPALVITVLVIAALALLVAIFLALLLSYLYCRWTRTGRIPAFHLSQEQSKKSPSGVAVFMHMPSPAGDYLYVNQIVIERFTGQERKTRSTISYMPNGAHGWNKLITAWEIVLSKIEQWFSGGRCKFMNPVKNVTRVTITLVYCPEYDKSRDIQISQTIDIDE